MAREESRKRGGYGEVVTTYLGMESPKLRGLAGRSIPCGHCRHTVCDAHGFQLGLAMLPGAVHGDGRLYPINRACSPHRKYQRISTVSPTFSRYARSARIAKVSTQYHSPNTNTSVSV